MTAVVAVQTFRDRMYFHNFAYRTGVGWAGFVGTGLATLVLAVLTVGFQSVKAASASPAETLKYE